MLEKIKIVLVSLGYIESSTDTSNDAVLQLMEEDTKSAMTLYCNRKVFPAKLEYLAREIVVDTIKKQNTDNVSSIKRGDMQINYNQVVSTEDFTEKQKMAMNKCRAFRVG